MANDHRHKLKEKFKAIKYFSATTDIWSRSNRSFIAVSVHYFDSSLDKSAEPVLKTDFIACDYFSGRHTHDRVAEKLYAIFERFGIRKNVNFVTSDGAGEYTAAFKFFADNYESIYLHDEDEDGTDDHTATTSVATVTSRESLQYEKEEADTDVVYKGDLPKNANHVDNSSFVIHDMEEILGRRILGKMNRIDCSAHKTDKLASIDAATALDNDPDYAIIHTSVFDKLTRIWALKESRLCAESFKQITGKSIIGPHRIRWLKMYEAVSLN